MGIWAESRDYKLIAASQTQAVLGPNGKAQDGDILVNMMIIPATTSPGKVSIFDGASGSEIPIFVGGATSVADLKPFWVVLNIRAKSPTSPRWVVTTGANVSVLCCGDFN